MKNKIAYIYNPLFFSFKDDNGLMLFLKLYVTLKEHGIIEFIRNICYNLVAKKSYERLYRRI